MSFFSAVLALFLCSLTTGCGLGLVPLAVAAKEEQSASSSSTTVVSKAGSGKVTVTTSRNTNPVSSQKPSSAAPTSGSVASSRPAEELGSCLVEGSDGEFNRSPFISSSVPRSKCADECNEMMAKVKSSIFKGCSYSCEWNSISLVQSFSNSEVCTIAVATLK